MLNSNDNLHIGIDFKEFLPEQGQLEESTLIAVERLKA